jgi:hypothetical protein
MLDPELMQLYEIIHQSKDQFSKREQALDRLNSCLSDHLNSAISSLVNHVKHEGSKLLLLPMNEKEQIMNSWSRLLSILDTMDEYLFQNEDIVQHCVLDILHPLLQLFEITLLLKDSKIDVSINHVNTLVSKLLQYIGLFASPRELVSITTHQIAIVYDNYMELNLSSDTLLQVKIETMLVLLNLLKSALIRVPMGKRYMFFANVFPLIAKKTFMQVKVAEANAHFDQDQMEQLVQEKERSDFIFSKYIHVLTDFTKDMSNGFRDKEFKVIRSDTGIKREHSWILFLCFQMLAKIYSSNKLIHEYESETNEIMRSISNCNCTFSYLLQYSHRYQAWYKVKNEMEIEDLEDRASHLEEEDEVEGDVLDSLQDEINNFVTWDFLGIGIFAYLLFVKGKEREQYAFGLFTFPHLFHICKPYIERMLQSSIPSICITAKLICQYFFDILPNYSLDIHWKSKTQMAELEDYFQFMQSLINFIASCPDNKERTDVFRILNDFISKFPDKMRYELLMHTIQSCPYPSLLCLIIDRLKEEIRLEYDSMLKAINRQLNPTKPYKPLQPPPIIEANKLVGTAQIDTSVSKLPIVQMDAETIRMLRTMAKNSEAFLQRDKVINLLVEMIPKYSKAFDDTENVDLTLQILNLIYFLILRDYQANILGIMDNKWREKLNTSIIQPLKSKLGLYLEAIERDIGTSQMEDADEEIDIDDIDMDEVLSEPEHGLTDEEIQILLELKAERKKQEGNILKDTTKNNLPSLPRLPHQEKIQLQLKLFILKDIICQIESLLSSNSNQKDE